MTFAGAVFAVVLAAGPLCVWGRGAGFESVSVRPAAGGASTSTSSAGRVHYSAVSLKALVMEAFDAAAGQVRGPSWMETALFEVDATMAPGTTREGFREMLRGLLEQRFGLRSHRDESESAGWALKVAERGPRMKATGAAVSGGDAVPASLGALRVGPDGFPMLTAELRERPGSYFFKLGHRHRLIAQRQTMGSLAGNLSGVLGRPVSDQTALTGAYDFVLSFSTEELEPPAVASSGRRITPFYLPNVFEALDGLGLRLERARVREWTLVVDGIERVLR